MSWSDNPYYDPSKFGLELVDSIEWDGESYEFNMTAVWKAKRGEYYIGDDSGCSCPAPFENVEKLEELDGPHNKRGLESALRYRLKQNARDESETSGYRYGRSYAELEKEVRELLAKLT
ncbi:hypothetical protein SEA_BILLNYE_174 [Streptomyces phage BillNye]|uniref:DUF7574 domain-containing protein n=2 Tax=Wilnyevirus billnye TaxID=2560486 RepID=A0A2L1IW10_9CAUD|nr:hypothetical protein FDJ30_gp087 [Streptomyces phage BillNye]AVD99346.1 hypothetical protein SEA_BILLNYE_174 [Streptomyces phage BillNye]QBZ72429.1 hypothetical protein SEA_CIRCINUS_175 [Streptomyces phage Circinus]